MNNSHLSKRKKRQQGKMNVSNDKKLHTKARMTRGQSFKASPLSSHKPRLKITPNRRVATMSPTTQSHQLHLDNNNVYIQQLCSRLAVLSTTLNLLPTTARKPLSTNNSSKITTPTTTLPNVDLFQVQDTANKLIRHTNSIDLTTEEGMEISNIVHKTMVDNIIPTQLSLLQRNRTIVSSVPGALFKNAIPTDDNRVSSQNTFSRDNLINNNNDHNRSSLVTQDEVNHYSTQLNSLHLAHGLVQQWRQILSLKQHEFSLLKEQQKRSHNLDHVSRLNNEALGFKMKNNTIIRDGTRPLNRTLTRLELWQQSLNTIISTQQSTNPQSSQLSSLLQQTKPLLTTLLQNKKKIQDLELKMSKHLLHKVLPSTYSQTSQKTPLYTELIAPLRQTVDEWNQYTHAAVNGNHGVLTFPMIVSSQSLPPLASTTINQIHHQMEEFFVTCDHDYDDNNNEDDMKATQHQKPDGFHGSANNLTVTLHQQYPTQNTHNPANPIFEFTSPKFSPLGPCGGAFLSKFKSTHQNTDQFLTPKFRSIFDHSMKSDSIYDNISIEITFLFNQQLELLPQFIPLAQQLEDLLDIPPFQVDKDLLLLPPPPIESSFHYHTPPGSSQIRGNSVSSIQYQQQSVKYISHLHQLTQKNALETFESNLMKKNIQLFIDTINTLESCIKSLNASLPRNLITQFNSSLEQFRATKKNHVSNKSNSNDQGPSHNDYHLDSMIGDEDLMLAPIDASGEYVYQGRKWKDIASNNLFTLLTSYEQLQARIVDFHNRQQIELEQLVEQQLVSSHHSINHANFNSNHTKKHSDFNEYGYHTAVNQRELESVEQYQIAAEKVEQIRGQLVELSQQPNTILSLHRPTVPTTSQICNLTTTGVDTLPQNAATTTPMTMSDHLPLHTLKARKNTPVSPTSSSLTHSQPPPVQQSPTQIRNLIPTTSEQYGYSNELLSNNAKISSLLDTQNAIIRRYEQNNKSHAFLHSRTLEPLTPHYTNGYALDIDGVLLKDGHLIPGVKDSLAKLFTKARGGNAPLPIPTVFMTNGGGVTETDKAAELSSKFGLDIHPDQIILASSPWRNLVPMLREKNIAIIGGKRSPEVAKLYGFENSFPLNDLREQHCDLIAPQAVQDNPMKYGQRTNLRRSKKLLSGVDAVMIWTDPRDWYVDLQVTLDVLIQSREKTAKDLNIPIGSYKSNPNLLSYHYKGISENNHIETAQFYQSNPLLTQLGTIQSDLPQDFFDVTQSYLKQYQPLHTPILLSNPDFIYSNRYDRPRLAQGSFAETLSYLYSRLTNEPLEFLTCGKPTPITYRLAEGKLLQQAQALSQSLQKPIVINHIYGIGDNPAADIRGANWASNPWISVFVHTGTILLDSNTDGGHHGTNSTGFEKQAQIPALEYPSISEAINELELIHNNIMGQLTLKL